MENLELKELEKELILIKANEPSALFLYGSQYLTRDEMVTVLENLIERIKQ